MNKKIAAIAIIAVVAVVSVGAYTALDNEGGSQKITIQGSTTIAPYILKVQEIYQQNTNTVLQITSNGSGTGASAAINGNADIAMLSRDLKQSEKDAGLVQTVIGLDGITAIVNKDAGITDLTLEQLEKIFSGQITNWNQVGGNDKPINVVSREEGSGTRDGFEESLKKADSGFTLTGNAIMQSSTNSVIRTVDNTTGSIGYVSIGYTDKISESTTVPSLNGVQATEENVKNGTYTIQRSLVLATMGEPQGTASDLIVWILGSEGQKLLVECGFIGRV